MTDRIIRLEVHRSNDRRRWPCAICGGLTNAEPWEATFRDEDGILRVVCRRCLDVGNQGILARLMDRVEELENELGFLRSLADVTWDVPPAHTLDGIEGDA